MQSELKCLVNLFFSVFIVWFHATAFRLFALHLTQGQYHD